MSNVVQMGQSCEFLLTRAARHRRAGRYDEAMALLSKAKDLYGFSEDIELEFANTYEEIGCDEEAQRAYLRAARLKGKHQAQAFYHLAILSAQRADFARAVSYYQRFAGMKQSEVSHERVVELGHQLEREMAAPVSLSRRARAHKLEQRAACCLQAGKPTAAERNMRHALALRPSSQGFTMLACCLMIREKYKDAIEYAEIAHELAPSRVQTICVLADACVSAGQKKKARKWVYLAAMRASDTDDLIAAAIESAKHGEDALTLRLTKTILKREPFCTRAMMLRACALTNLGRLSEAGRLFGRLCGLMPDDIVSDTYFRMTKDGHKPAERLSLGLDVTHQEGVEWAKELLSLLYEDPAVIREDSERVRSICRRCFWAIRSPMAGSHVKTIVLILLSTLDTPETKEVLLDALVDPNVPDSFKAGILQVMTAKNGFVPYDVDFGGRLVRLAAGGVSSQPVRTTEMNQKIVQRVSDALAPEFPDAARFLLPLYLSYMERYGTPKGRHEHACAAALEYVYHEKNGNDVDLHVIAAKYDVPERLCAVFSRRLMRMETKSTDQNETEDIPDEVH